MCAQGIDPRPASGKIGDRSRRVSEALCHERCIGKVGGGVLPAQDLLEHKGWFFVGQLSISKSSNQNPLGGIVLVRSYDPCQAVLGVIVDDRAGGVGKPSRRVWKFGCSLPHQEPMLVTEVQEARVLRKLTMPPLQGGKAVSGSEGIGGPASTARDHTSISHHSQCWRRLRDKLTPRPCGSGLVWSDAQSCG